MCTGLHHVEYSRANWLKTQTRATFYICIHLANQALSAKHRTFKILKVFNPKATHWMGTTPWLTSNRDTRDLAEQPPGKVRRQVVECSVSHFKSRTTNCSHSWASCKHRTLPFVFLYGNWQQPLLNPVSLPLSSKTLAGLHLNWLNKELLMGLFKLDPEDLNPNLIVIDFLPHSLLPDSGPLDLNLTMRLYA